MITYDLTVAMKAYCIQDVERPLFDRLVTILGNFHVEVAFFAAVGHFISGSGIECLV